MDALFDQDLRGLFAIVGAVLIAWSLKRAVSRLSKGRQGENRVRRVLKAGGFACAHDLLLPTGEKDGWTQIDHVVALPGRLVSIEPRPCPAISMPPRERDTGCNSSAARNTVSRTPCIRTSST